MKNSRRQGAFTLIEMLIVLIIVSIITAIAVVAFHNFGRGRRARIAIQTLKNVVQLTQQRAMLQHIIIGMQFTDQGYQFLLYVKPTIDQPSDWEPLTSDTLSSDNAFPSQMVFSVKLKGQPAQLPQTLQSKKSPKILFLPSGYVTPFSAIFRFDNNVGTLSVNESGKGSLDQ